MLAGPLSPENVSADGSAGTGGPSPSAEPRHGAALSCLQPAGVLGGSGVLTIASQFQLPPVHRQASADRSDPPSHSRPVDSPPTGHERGIELSTYTTTQKAFSRSECPVQGPDPLRTLDRNGITGAGEDRQHPAAHTRRITRNDPAACDCRSPPGVRVPCLLSLLAANADST